MIKFKKTHKKNANANIDYRIITNEQPLSLAAEAYRRIKVSLDFANIDSKLKVLQVCSSQQSEGKSITVLNMASTYVENGKNVIVVDLDLRRPKLHRSFGINNYDGITDVLTGSIDLDKAIKYNEKYRFSLLNSGSKTIYPSALLSSNALKELFSNLKKKFDYIIVDCPPILAVSDAVIISELCDGCLFIVSEQKTSKNLAKEAIHILRKNNVNLLGIVFNNRDSDNIAYNLKYNYYKNDYNED